ncbi:M20/M25/M40 family metallo-hydrolase [Halorubrum vacuolatum]|uniref:Acetylornithine deacetylase/Succinyl-diaminopimelate desuccinylase n=1 Tax=Halorubrum vacuolatum TaxID=63740 RepID=A0A238W0Y6_HALVU|nr:M20/M25/M40 family metallo-hydrolase [Halorubrum vacuolatum]SNR40176.1 Acetylornithine deacetylase/Succinyl-diaminopimelate desuccinylase [Halorubrum vacuolatum]
MTPINTVDAAVDDRFEEYVADLTRLVSQPSISATGEGIRECAELLRSLTAEYGFDTAEIVETSGHPAVIAHAFVDNDPDNDAPTVLVYGHYDVQPVVPAEWTDPPFEPTRREIDGREYLYGRGTVDNKGQHVAYLAAVETLRETVGLPVNVTLLLDGEEESGSPNLMEVVEARESALRADVSINSDGPVDESGRPTVVFGNRGILIVEVSVRGPNGDLHSGHYGGAIPNPARELTRLLGTMYADDGRIAIDGFYDDIEPITETDRDLIAAIEPDIDELTAKLGVGDLEDGPGETVLEKTLYYPTLNINGLAGGHVEEGYKTIVPSTASATIDARLVVDQTPDGVFDRIAAHVERHADDRFETTLTRHGEMDPTRTPVDSPYRKPLVDAVAEGWGAEPVVKPLSGGSAPYALFTDVLGLPHVSIPHGQRDNNQHSADEHYALDHFKKGIRTSTRVLRAVATAADEDRKDGADAGESR